MNAGQLAAMLATSPTHAEAAAKTAGAVTAGGGVALVAAQDLFAGISVGAIAGGLMVVSGAAMGAYGNWRQKRREEREKDDAYRRASAEEDAKLRKRIEEINAGSLTAEIAAIGDRLAHAEERIEAANAKLHQAVSDRAALQMLAAQQSVEVKYLQKQLGLPPGPDPELGSDQQVTLAGIVKQTVKDAIRESDDEIATDDWPTPRPAPEAPKPGDAK